MFFVKNFVENICTFYNFVRNNYLRRNYPPIKIHKTNNKKKNCSAKFYNKFVGEISQNIKNSNSGCIFKIY